MKQTPSIEDLCVVPEKWIFDIAHMSNNDPDSTMNIILNSGEEFKKAGLTPIYLADKSLTKILVTTKEKLDKKFH